MCLLNRFPLHYCFIGAQTGCVQKVANRVCLRCFVLSGDVIVNGCWVTEQVNLCCHYTLYFSAFLRFCLMLLLVVVICLMLIIVMMVMVIALCFCNNNYYHN